MGACADPADALKAQEVARADRSACAELVFLRGRKTDPWLLAGGRRRADDVKGRTNWVQLDLPRPVTAMRRRELFRELRMRYGEKAETKSAMRPRSPTGRL